MLGFVLGHYLSFATICLADGTATKPAAFTNGLVLKRVELFPAGQGVFEYDSTNFRFDDKTVQSQIDQALNNIVKPKTARSTVTLWLKKKDRGSAGIAFQTETAAWKSSYRIAKIDGENQLVVSAVIDNNTGLDWIDVELVLIVDQPLGFHTPLSTVHRSQRTLIPIPSPFSAAISTAPSGFAVRSNASMRPRPFDRGNRALVSPFA